MHPVQTNLNAKGRLHTCSMTVFWQIVHWGCQGDFEVPRIQNLGPRHIYKSVYMISKDIYCISLGGNFDLEYLIRKIL